MGRELTCLAVGSGGGCGGHCCDAVVPNYAAYLCGHCFCLVTAAVLRKVDTATGHDLGLE